MKAARYSQFGGPEVLEIVDLPDPHAGPGQIRIAVHAAGVNATDCKRRQGLLDGDLPQLLGAEVAGVVDEVGAGVTDVTAGDRVFGISEEGTGGSAELALLSAYAPIPPSLGFAEAAVLPVALEVATRTLDALGVGAGSILLINGAAGGIGSAAIQLARPRGPRAGRDRRADRGRALLAPGCAGLPAGRDRGGAPRQRKRSGAREDRAARRLTRPPREKGRLAARREAPLSRGGPGQPTSSTIFPRA